MLFKNGATKCEEISKDGNTNSSFSKTVIKETDRDNAINWCFTLNNYSDSENGAMVLWLNLNSKEYVVGKEIGENGTPHLQGYVSLYKKARLSALKKVNVRIHWERCRNVVDSKVYCAKDGNYICKGVREFELIKNDMFVYKGEDLPSVGELYDWEIDVLDIINGKVDDRKVIWIYDSVGNSGKSMFCKYLMWNYNISCLSKGKYSDIMNILFNKIIIGKTVVFDLPRNNGNKISYDALESIKNGVIVNTKYETGEKLFCKPHVFVFANVPPEEEKLSLDRWCIYEIVNKTLVKRNVGEMPDGYGDELDEYNVL